MIWQKEVDDPPKIGKEIYMNRRRWEAANPNARDFKHAITQINFQHDGDTTDSLAFSQRLFLCHCFPCPSISRDVSTHKNTEFRYIFLVSDSSNT